jgi:hypothetical protein
LTVLTSACDDRRMNRLPLLVTVSLLATLPLAPSATADPAATQVVKVLAWTTQERLTPKPPPGLVGDVATGRDRLRNAVPQFGRPKGAVVGRDSYRVVVKSANAFSFEVTVSFPDGTVRCRGTTRLRPTIVIPLVGGTGAYAGASGTCAATEGSKAACTRPDERQRVCDLNTYRIRT